VDSVIRLKRETVSGHNGFRILKSGSDPALTVMIPADLAACPQCLSEITDPADRRYGYPFTTCTLCGPRYTVVHGMPYDRERTTLSAFPLCPDCRAEYEDPTDRRFHAESIAAVINWPSTPPTGVR
jgi:hydrogenase maturation protein HypF